MRTRTDVDNWSPALDDALRRFVAAGLTDKEIGLRLGRNKWNVYERRRRLGISKYPGEQPLSPSRKRTKRPCIRRCGRFIMSEGPHHRMYQVCRNISVSPFAI